MHLITILTRLPLLVLLLIVSPGPGAIADEDAATGEPDLVRAGVEPAESVDAVLVEVGLDRQGLGQGISPVLLAQPLHDRVGELAVAPGVLADAEGVDREHRQAGEAERPGRPERVVWQPARLPRAIANPTNRAITK